MKKITTAEAKRKVMAVAVKGRVFGVTFNKKDGSPRTMNCRLRQNNLLKGGERAWNPEETNQLFVVDVNKGGYRTINFNTMTRIAVNKEEYEVIKE